MEVGAMNFENNGQLVLHMYAYSNDVQCRRDLHERRHGQTDARRRPVRGELYQEYGLPGCGTFRPDFCRAPRPDCLSGLRSDHNMQRPPLTLQTPCPCHPVAIAGNLSRPVGCVDLGKPVAGLGGPVPRLDMRYRAGRRRREFTETRGCLACGAGNAGLVKTNVGIFGAWRLYGGVVETCGNVARMGICEAWAAVCGPRDVEM